MRRGDVMNTENNQTEEKNPARRIPEDFIDRWCEMQFKKNGDVLRKLAETETKEREEALAKKKAEEEG